MHAPIAMGAMHVYKDMLMQRINVVTDITVYTNNYLYICSYNPKYIHYAYIYILSL